MGEDLVRDLVRFEMQVVWPGILLFEARLPSSPINARHEVASYLEAIQSAANAGGRYYVMVEPTRSIAHGPFVRLTLAKAGDTLFNDDVYDQQELEVSNGRLGYLNAKYGYLGMLETFDDFSTGQVRYAQILEEVKAHKKLSQAES